MVGLMAMYIDKKKGNDFDGELISGRYRSPDLTFGDPGIRKHMQRVLINYKPESAINADMFVSMIMRIKTLQNLQHIL